MSRKTLSGTLNLLASSGGNGDLTNILIAVFGAVWVIITGLIGYIFNELRKDVAELDRHFKGVLKVIGPLMWRTIEMEKYLKDELDYDAPVGIEWPDGLF